MKNIYKFSSIRLAFILFILILNHKTEASEYNHPNFSLTESEKLLSRLNLDLPELKNVKDLSNDPTKATTELLAYYRSRNHVKHFVDRNLKNQSLSSYASEKDLKMANDALKHIFVGQPAYPPHFCGDDINWNSRPVPDNEWVWQLNRMTFWDAMAKAYWHTGNEEYAREWCYQLVDWVKKNPNDPEHNYAWRSIEAGIRGYRWTGIYQHFVDAPSFTPDVLTVFLNSLYDHADYLMKKYSKGSNWGLMEAEGMAFIAITFPEFKDSEKWKNEAIKRLTVEIDNQVYSDGHQRELSINYHMGCIGWFVRTYDLAKINRMESEFPNTYLQKIEKMCEVPMKLGFQDGTTPQFGDAWSGKPGQYADRFLEWSKIFGREDFLYMATQGKEGRKPDSTAYCFPQSGLYSMRSGWNEEDICLVLKNADQMESLIVNLTTEHLNYMQGNDISCLMQEATSIVVTLKTELGSGKPRYIKP